MKSEDDTIRSNVARDKCKFTKIIYDFDSCKYIIRYIT